MFISYSLTKTMREILLLQASLNRDERFLQTFNLLCLNCSQDCCQLLNSLFWLFHIKFVHFRFQWVNYYWVLNIPIWPFFSEMHTWVQIFFIFVSFIFKLEQSKFQFAHVALQGLKLFMDIASFHLDVLDVVFQALTHVEELPGF